MPLAQQISKIPHLRGFYIGAPGFEPGTSPTRITRAPSSRQQEIPAKRAVCRFVDHSEPPQTLGYSGGLPGIGHRNALCAQSPTSRDSPGSAGSPALLTASPIALRAADSSPTQALPRSRRPATVSQPQGLSPAPARVRLRTVVAGRQTSVPAEPVAHCPRARAPGSSAARSPLVSSARAAEVTRGTSCSLGRPAPASWLDNGASRAERGRSSGTAARGRRACCQTRWGIRRPDASPLRRRRPMPFSAACRAAPAIQPATRASATPANPP
jgi:hypothetical protein